MLALYGFRDKKSSVVSNHFVTGDPVGKVQERISIALLELQLKQPTSPFILYSKDYELIKIMDLDDLISSGSIPDDNRVPFDTLLAASRSAYDLRSIHTSPDDELNITQE